MAVLPMYFWATSNDCSEAGHTDCSCCPASMAPELGAAETGWAFTDHVAPAHDDGVSRMCVLIRQGLHLLAHLRERASK